MHPLHADRRRGGSTRCKPGAHLGRGAELTAEISSEATDTVIDLIPFVLVSDVERSIAFYEALGFRVMRTYAPNQTLEFAALEATSAAKLMLARVDELPARDPDTPGPGFLYLYTPDLDAFRQRLIAAGFEQDEIQEEPGPGPDRELCVRDPDGHGHMVAELVPGG